VECFGKGKAHRLHEFGVKVSVATPLHRCKGSQFIAHVAALPANPYDGHTLAAVVPAIEQQIGVSLTRIITDKGYRGHNAPPGRRRSVCISGRKRGVTAVIRRELRQCAAIEPAIGHVKPSTESDATISLADMVMPPTPSWQPSDTTSADCSHGSWLCCACPWLYIASSASPS
jgi:transposase, IS5 family